MSFQTSGHTVSTFNEWSFNMPLMMVAVSCPPATTPPAPGATPNQTIDLAGVDLADHYGVTPAMALTSMLVSTEAPLPTTVKCR